MVPAWRSESTHRKYHCGVIYERIRILIYSSLPYTVEKYKYQFLQDSPTQIYIEHCLIVDLTSDCDAVLVVTGRRSVPDQVRSVVQDSIRVAGWGHDIRVVLGLIQNHTNREPERTDLREKSDTLYTSSNKFKVLSLLFQDTRRIKDLEMWDKWTGMICYGTIKLSVNHLEEDQLVWTDN